MLFLRRIYIARGRWHLVDFCNIFLPNLVKTKKSPTICVLGPGAVPYAKTRWLLHYVHKKFRLWPEVAIFRTKTLDFTLVIRLNWLKKVELKECAVPPARQYYLLLITVVRVYYCTQRC